MAHPYVLSQEGLLCLPAQSQECGGDTRRWAITQGELDKAVEGQQPSSRTSISPKPQGPGTSPYTSVIYIYRSCAPSISFVTLTYFSSDRAAILENNFLQIT